MNKNSFNFMNNKDEEQARLKAIQDKMNYKDTFVVNPYATEQRVSKDQYDRMLDSTSQAKELETPLTSTAKTGSQALSDPSKIKQSDINTVSSVEDSEGGGGFDLETFADVMSKRPKFTYNAPQAANYGDVGEGVDMSSNNEAMDARRKAILGLLGRA